MKKKVFAIILILVFILTPLTACSDDNQAKITQIQTDFNALVSEATELMTLIVSGVASGIDLSQLTTDFFQVLDFINDFSLTALNGLSGAALDGIIAQLQGMTSTLTDLYTKIQNAINGVPDDGGDITNQNLIDIHTEMAAMNASLDEIKNLLQPEPVPQP